MSEATIPVVRSSDKANYPYLVQTGNTAHWNTTGSAVTLEAAQELAQDLQQRYPRLPVRIQHCTGGMLATDQLPKYQRRTSKDERPHRMALWTGADEPPALLSRVEIRINGIGPGTVTGYAVCDGYLGVMVRADEATRPDWHKSQNPQNEPGIVFGVELN